VSAEPEDAAQDHVDVDVEGRHLRLSNLGKVLWPDAGFTKAQMIDYYRAVAPALLPHLRNHPVTLARFPYGVDADGFYQTNCRGNPPWLSTHEVSSRRGTPLRYCVVNDLPSLLWVANLATVELHPLLSTTEGPERAPSVVFDLDPGPPAAIAGCCRVALWLREELAGRGLEAFPKTSGWKGIHLHVPLGDGATFERTKRFAELTAARLAKRHPDEVVTHVSRQRRVGRVLIDWRQNDPNRSIIAPYSLRSTRVPGVATPLLWEEVETAAASDMVELRFSPGEVMVRLEQLEEDPFARLPGLAQALPD
jgi:bifunctional non-homologous end joining protein LigD